MPSLEELAAMQPVTVNQSLLQKIAAQRSAYPRRQLTTTQDALDFGAGVTGLVPGIGDAMGLAADVHRYATEPESRTIGNYGLSLLGLLPFMPGLTVFHGSPYRFNKFDMGKVGVGEGAQTRGHGLYFAERKGTARNYQSDAPAKEIGPVNPTLYSVDLPDEVVAKMLDWDKPLSQQSQAVKDFVAKNSWFSPRQNEKTMGEVFLRARKDGDPEIAMREAGISGVKYLDRGSRTSGAGTYNFVVFDDTLPRIVQRE